jgi:hypothetical protein
MRHLFVIDTSYVGVVNLPVYPPVLPQGQDPPCFWIRCFNQKVLRHLCRTIMKTKLKKKNDEFHRLAVILYYGTDQQFDPWRSSLSSCGILFKPSPDMSNIDLPSSDLSSLACQVSDMSNSDLSSLSSSDLSSSDLSSSDLSSSDLSSSDLSSSDLSSSDPSSSDLSSSDL